MGVSSVDYALIAFIAWITGFGFISSLLWVRTDKKKKDGKLSFYPFALVLRLGVAVKPSPGRRFARRLSWLFVVLMAASMAFFYIEILYAAYMKYFAPAKSSVAALTPLIPGVTIAWRDVPIILAAIGVGVLFHEAAHALAARIEGVRVKNAGLALIAFIPAAFVEVDEDDIAKASLSSKAKIFSAGVAVNILLALLVMPLIGLFSSGVLVLSVDQQAPAGKAGLMPGDVIVKVDGFNVKDVNSLNEALTRLGVKDPRKSVTLTVTVIRDVEKINISVTKPEGRTLLGITVTTMLTGLGPFLYAVWLINLALALINAAPLFITDGGQLVREVMIKVAGKTGIVLSTGIQVSTLILVLSLMGITRIVIPH